MFLELMNIKTSLIDGLILTSGSHESCLSPEANSVSGRKHERPPKLPVSKTGNL